MKTNASGEPIFAGKTGAQGAQGIQGLAGSSPAVNEGRLTLSSGVPVITSDVLAATTLYWTPHLGSLIGLYDGAADQVITSSEVSLSLSGLLPFTLYDIFGYYNSGALALETLAWNAGATGSITGCTNASPPVVTATAHGRIVGDMVAISGVVGATGINGTFRISAVTTNTFTLVKLDGTAISAPGVYSSGGTWYLGNYVGTRATAVDLRHAGYLCKHGDATRRFLGTIRMTDTAGQSQMKVSSGSCLLLANYYNRVRYDLIREETTGSWSYTTATWRLSNNDYANRVEFVVAVADQSISGAFMDRVRVAAVVGFIGIGLDQFASIAPLTTALNTVNNGSGITLGVHLATLPSAGYHFVTACEIGGTGVQFDGNGGVGVQYHHLETEVWL